MFGNRYFANRYYPDRFFPNNGAVVPPVVVESNAPAYSSGKGWAKYAFTRAQPHGVEQEKPKQFTPTKANDNKPKRKQRGEAEVIRSLADLGTAYQDKFTAQKESAEAQAEQQRLQAATLRKQALLAQQQADDDMLIMLVLAAA